MFLSRLTFNAQHPRARSEAQRPYEIHRTLSKAWSELEPARVLFRPDQDHPGLLNVVVQSHIKPDWSRLDAPRDYLRQVDGPKEVRLEGLKQGQRLRFRLRCNPSKRIGDKNDKDKGKRRALKTKEEIFKWLERKGEAAGFTVLDAGFDRVYWQHSKGGVREQAVGGVLFNGILVVADPEKLRAAVAGGLGPGKAFGFGLLSLAPA